MFFSAAWAHYGRMGEEIDHYYPKEENLGYDCMFWDLGKLACDFPKIEMQGRRSCEGLIDDVCLFLKDGRHPLSLTLDQIANIRTRPPSWGDKSDIPPGEPI